jgi:hypothetical protein
MFSHDFTKEYFDDASRKSRQLASDVDEYIYIKKSNLKRPKKKVIIQHI